MTVDESVSVKGSPARSLQRFIDSELTPEQRQKIFSDLPPEIGARLRAPVLATESIPVHMLNRLTEAAARIKGEPLDAFARRAGRDAASDAVKGIYRFFALMLTPTSLLSRASPMWSTLYSRGDLRVDNQTDHSARVRLLNYPSEAANCLRITGWIERLAELTGAKNIDVKQTQCYAKGAPNCEWNITWE